MTISKRLNFRWNSIRLGLFAFGIILVVGYGSDLLTVRHPEWMVVDDLVLGFVAAWVVILYEERRTRLIREKLNVIREMNSYVRNELQVLVAAVPGEATAQTIDAVQRCVDHIDWALREILPGKHYPAVQQITDSPEHPEGSTRRSA